MEHVEIYAIVIARVLIALIFLLNAAGVIDQNDASSELAGRGVPLRLVPPLMFLARTLQCVAGLAMTFGVFPRLSALALLAFIISATFVSHLFWLTTNRDVRQTQLRNFAGNLAIWGGLLLVAAVNQQPSLFP